MPVLVDTVAWVLPRDRQILGTRSRGRLGRVDEVTMPQTERALMRLLGLG